ncbi:hypothetical protein D918_03932 [Trichuris suis]|nr:hypothetical protein D918_03932 [Trichuris suis]
MQALTALRRISMSASGRDWIVEGWWIRDHKPDPWPETPEERKAAARKYGLREEDYVSLPRDKHVGNYPDLGLLNYDLKDPYEDWSYGTMRRNYNEPKPKQYAYDYDLAWPFKDPKNFPLVHYTFEPADSD